MCIRDRYEVVGSAENGVEALELAEHLHPDVIMTDIKMSFMDGLQLCEHIAEKMPSVKMIIFSGFDDFEYAQKAIKLNVTEYLLCLLYTSATLRSEYAPKAIEEAGFKVEQLAADTAMWDKVKATDLMAAFISSQGIDKIEAVL